MCLSWRDKNHVVTNEERIIQPSCMFGVWRLFATFQLVDVSPQKCSVHQVFEWFSPYCCFDLCVRTFYLIHWVVISSSALVSHEVLYLWGLAVIFIGLYPFEELQIYENTTSVVTHIQINVSHNQQRLSRYWSTENSLVSWSVSRTSSWMFFEESQKNQLQRSINGIDPNWSSVF